MVRASVSELIYARDTETVRRHAVRYAIWNECYSYRAIDVLLWTGDSKYFIMDFDGNSYQTPELHDFIKGKLPTPFSFKIPTLPERLTKTRGHVG